MKNISLKNLKEVDQLSREQLKNVLGGFAGSGTTTGCSGKSEWDSCTNTEGKSGKCKYIPFNSGLVCWAN